MRDSNTLDYIYANLGMDLDSIGPFAPGASDVCTTSVALKTARYSLVMVLANFSVH